MYVAPLPRLNPSSTRTPLRVQANPAEAVRRRATLSYISRVHRRHAPSRVRSSIASPHFNGCPPRELARQLLLNDSTDEFSDLTTEAQLQFTKAAYSRARSRAASPHSNGRTPP